MLGEFVAGQDRTACSLRPSAACRGTQHFGVPERAGKLPAPSSAKAVCANASEEPPLIETGLTGRSCFPASMDPNPLPRIGANKFFDLGGVERGSIDDVLLGVAGGADRFD